MLPCARNRLSFARGFALLVAVGLGFVLGPTVCLAQDTKTYYLKDRIFEIPYTTTSAQNSKQVHLHVSTDRKVYSKIGSTEKLAGAFTYTAKDDGEYFFVVQVEYGNNLFSPERPELVAPTLRVVVDTEKPQVALRAVVPTKGRAAVEWEIVDKNLDLRTLRLDAKGPGETNWTPLNINLLMRAQFGWNPLGSGPIDVRLSVKDLAGNEATATTQVTPSASAAVAPGVGDDRQVIYVKQKRFRLNYKIEHKGRSSVGEVQVWKTRDGSQWDRFGTAPATGPHELTVPTTGRYGFTLRPLSGVKRGPAAPRGGDLPQVWVEVDETPPDVRLGSVYVGDGADSEKIVVNWSATDKFMKDQPITILYGASATGPWKPLQENLENAGTAKVTPPEGVFEFFVKVEAMDKAGNKGSAQTREPIKVDLHEPKVTEISIGSVEVTPSEQPPP